MKQQLSSRAASTRARLESKHHQSGVLVVYRRDADGWDQLAVIELCRLRPADVLVEQWDKGERVP